MGLKISRGQISSRFEHDGLRLTVLGGTFGDLNSLLDVESAVILGGHDKNFSLVRSRGGL